MNSSWRTAFVPQPTRTASERPPPSDCFPTSFASESEACAHGLDEAACCKIGACDH